MEFASLLVVEENFLLQREYGLKNLEEEMSYWLCVKSRNMKQEFANSDRKLTRFLSLPSLRCNAFIIFPLLMLPHGALHVSAHHNTFRLAFQGRLLCLILYAPLPSLRCDAFMVFLNLMLPHGVPHVSEHNNAFRLAFHGQRRCLIFHVPCAEQL